MTAGEGSAPVDSQPVSFAATPPSNSLAIDFLHRLVATPSLSGRERAAVELFVTQAAAMGLSCEIDEAGNGIATRSSSGGVDLRRIALLGHIDTVPGDIAVRIERGILHGRGSVDAKGSLAAMLFAAARATLPPGVAIDVVAAVGEETPRSPGARFVRDRMRPAACIVGEPSGAAAVTLGYKGRLVMRAECRADAAHTAGPAPSPADVLHAFWSHTLTRAESLNVGRDAIFERVQASLRATASSGDGLVNRAMIEAGFRVPPWLSPVDWERDLREVAADTAASCGVSLLLEFEGHEAAVRSPREDAVVRALVASIRERGEAPRLKVKTGTADFNVVAPVWRCPIAAYGPGDSSLDHSPREHLSLEEYVAAIDVLTRAIERLAAELASTPPSAAAADGLR